MYGHKGLVLHIEQGSEKGTDSWFHNPKAQASAHFGNAKDGTLHQWVDTDDTAWAEVAGNHYWISVENEGYSGQPLTQAQEETLAKLLLWCHKTHGVPIQIATSPDGYGLGHHAMGGADWGGHSQCPGEPIINQKPYIVNRAKALGDFPAPAPKKAAPKPKPKTVPPAWYHRVLASTKPMMHGDDVKHVQQKLHVEADGIYGPNTEAKVRGFQKLHKLTADGKVGPETAKALG